MRKTILRVKEYMCLRVRVCIQEERKQKFVIRSLLD